MEGRLTKYYTWLFSTNRTNDVKGRYAKYAFDFLKSVDSVTRTAYRQYLKENAADIVKNNGMKEALLDVLDCFGHGYRKTPPTKKTAKKRVLVDEENKKKIDEFMVWLQKQREYSPCTLRLYRETAYMFFQYFDRFTNENVRLFADTLEAEKLSPQTVSLRVKAMRQFGRFAKTEVTVRAPKVQRSLDTDNIPTEGEYRKILECTRGTEMYFFIKILATTGARCSEFLEMKWGDILNGECLIKGKGAKWRKFIFNRQLVQEVAAMNPAPEQYVARTKRAMLTNKTLNMRLKVVAKRAGIDEKKLHCHAFRHFFAKMYLEKTKDVVRLADILGHTNIDTTRIYLQKSHEEQKRDIDRHVTW